jgi:hypothetical protein
MKFNYQSKEWTRAAYLSPDDVAIVAAKGTGKTYTCSQWCFRMAMKFPGSRGLITMNTRQQVRDIFNQDLKPVFDMVPYTLNKTEGDVSFFNGSIIHLRSAEPEAAKKVESVTYDWWWGDECSFYAPDVMRLFYSRIRTGMRRKRITSMPDDPDAFLYQFIEHAGITLFELSLYDNPNSDFADGYAEQLKMVYQGEQLKRYLHGLRTSLSGTGLFYLTTDHLKTTPINPADDIHLVWDFNVEYRAVSAWQQTGKIEPGYPTVNCVKSWQMREPTVALDAEQLCNELETHKGLIYLNGDASGDNRTAQATGSMWKSIRDVFERRYPGRIRYVVKASNPPIKDTIQCANWALNSNLIAISEPAKKLYNSVVSTKADKYGEIDKSQDYKDGGARSHEMDTFRYAVWYFYGRHYSKKTFFIV